MEAEQLNRTIAKEVLGYVWKHGALNDSGADGWGWGIPNYRWVNPKTQPYSEDMRWAWEVHKKACSWIFSERRRYLATLRDVVSERLYEEGAPVLEDAKVAWPDVLVFLKPVDICNAALRVVRNYER